jgi:hypothetical protein
MIDTQLSRYGIEATKFAGMNPAAKVFFVGPSAANWYGEFVSVYGPDVDGGNRAFASLESCTNDSNVVASRGDFILLLPGFTEAITAAAGIDLDKAGVTIIGLGNGTLRPTISFTTATSADIDIDAANITIENVIFDLTGVDALAAPIDVNATDFTMRNCKVITASASAQATLGILTDANASRMRIEGCEFLGTTDAGTAAAVRIVGGNEHVVKNNRFYGAYTTTLGAIDNVTTASLRCTIEGNVIENATASATKAMVFVSTSTGSIYNNRMQILSGTAPITGAAMSWVGANYYAGTIATAGVLI